MENSEFRKVRSVKENYAARLARMSFESKERMLANADEINIRHVQRCAELKDAILALPARLGEQLAGEQDARTVEDIFSASLREALQGAT